MNNEPLSGMEDERQITSEGVPVGELHNDIGTVFQLAKSSSAFTVQSKPIIYCMQIHVYVFPAKTYHCMITFVL